MIQELPAATASIAALHPPHGPDVRAHLEQQRAALRPWLGTPGHGGVELSRRHAAAMDDILRTLYGLARAAEAGGEEALLVGAVGGYGRRLLGWKSDVDVCFLTAGPPEAIGRFVDRMLYPLWDAGISVGHQVVTLPEVEASAVHDLPTATELLDLRPIAGDLSLAHALSARLSSTVFSPRKIAAFIARLEEQTSARHRRFGDSVYLLEPDVKNGTGGLRDLDYALWAARARFRAHDLDALCARGVLPAARVAEVAQAADFLWTVRNQLHELSGRRADRLTFAAQEATARAMGYASQIQLEPDASPVQQTGAMVEAFMSEYYRHARVLTHASDQILGHAKRRLGAARPCEVSLGGGLLTCEGGIGLVDPSTLAGTPALALRLYVSAVARHQPVLARTRDAIAQLTKDPAFCERLRSDREAAALFVQLVASHRTAPFRAGSIVSELHDVGLLLAIIPEFSPVVGRVHHDIYHVYTVDVHSVAAVDRLHALVRGELATEHPLGCRLAAEITRPKMLALATLLHDVGKAIGGHNHAQRGAEMARPILERLGLSPEDVDDACHLILKHLSLYVVAARRDLGDLATIADFAGEVRGREGLRDLYLLTVADLSTTSPTAMTRWKATMVDALFRATDALLSGSTTFSRGRLARVCAQVRALWPEAGAPRAIEEYLDTMPERYLLANAPEDIVAHALVATAPTEAPVVAALVPSKSEEVMGLCVVASTRLCVVAGDRPGLLAAIAAAISANRLCIQAAQVHSRALPTGGMQAVDLFWLQVPSTDEPGIEERMEKLESDLNLLITGALAPRALVRPPRKASGPCVRAVPPVATQVVIENHASSCHTIVEVLAQDCPALLFELAEVFQQLGLTISVAKISTEGERVIDVFYVTEEDGRKLAPGARTDEVRRALLARLEAEE